MLVRVSDIGLADRGDADLHFSEESDNSIELPSLLRYQEHHLNQHGHFERTSHHN